MENTKVETVYDRLKKEVPSAKRETLKQSLQNADEKTLDKLTDKTISKTLRITLFSVFIGWWGVDRFLIGDKIFGATKLICTALATIVSFVFIFVAVLPPYESYISECNTFIEKYTSISSTLSSQISALSDAIESQNEIISTALKNDSEDSESTNSTILTAQNSIIRATAVYQASLNSFVTSFETRLNTYTGIKVNKDIVKIYSSLKSAIEKSITANTALIESETYSDELAEKVVYRATNKDYGVSAKLSSFQTKLNNLPSDYQFTQAFTSMLCKAYYSILYTIMVCYWIFDIFYVRLENKRQNYSKIIETLELAE
jgi:hypothetical protein